MPIFNRLKTMTAEEIRHNRHMYLLRGGAQFGHAGMHHGSGSEECPKREHHHHDELCPYPTKRELLLAGINPEDFTVQTRRGR